MKSPRLYLLALLVACLCVPSVTALDVLIEEDRLYLKAKRDKLSDILDRFVHLGVHVEVDPKIDAYVSGEIDGDDMEEAMDALLEKFSHVLVWEVMDGPLGRIPRLAEIQIFKPGRSPYGLRPVEKGDGNLNVVTGPSGGAKFVADEILITVRRGVKKADVQKLLRELGGTLVASIPRLGIYKIKVPPGTNILALVEQLNQNNLIAQAEPNYALLKPPPTVGTASGDANQESAVRRVATDAPPVAILDSGLTNIQGLDQFVTGRLDALDPERSLTDRSGHGTQMALVATGSVLPDGVPSGGEANGSPIVAIRAFDDNGYASNFGIMRSIEYAYQQGSRVLSMSWGTETDSAFLKRAVRDAQQRGMVVVASAGNEPTGKPVYPAAYSGVIAITALEPDGSIWNKSNYGEFAYAAAPGKATFPIGHEGPPGPYAGTSIGTPYVASQLNLYMLKNPDLSANEVVKRFRESLTDSGEKGRDDKYGHGAFDANAIQRFRAKN